MARLLWVELRRTLARGVTRLLTLAGVVTIVGLGVVVFVTNKDLDARRAEARADYDRIVSQCVVNPQLLDPRTTPWGPGPSAPSRGLPGGPPSAIDPSGGEADVPPAGSPELRARCEATYTGLLTSRDGRAFELSQLWPGPPDYQRFGAPDPTIADVPALFSGVVMFPAFLLIVGAVIAGASMAGAEWQAGSLVVLLTWEPRRWRLLVARMLASAAVGAVITVGLLGLFTAVMAITAVVKGNLPATTHWWVSYAGVVLRLGAFTGLAAAVGTALATIGRRTALAVLAVPLYLIGAEIVVRLYWEAARPWLLLRNLALALGGEEYLPDAGSALRGGLVLLGWSGLIVALALVAFNRRDFVSSA